SAGFVSTSEIQSIQLAGPNVGAMAEVNGSPLLFDVENNKGVAHLDGKNGNATFSGLVYEASSGSSGGGGVEIDPGQGTNQYDKATLTGQVIAYSLAFFGNGNGVGVDFSNWWGTGNTAPAGTGNYENSLITVPPNALAAGSKQGPDHVNTETVYLQYNDEHFMDGYHLSMNIDNAATSTYFSYGLWNGNYNAPPNPSGTAQKPWPPENGYFPSDANPMFATAAETTPSPTAYANGAPPSNGVSYYDNSMYSAPPTGYNWPTGGSAKPNELVYQSDPNQDDNNTFDVSGDWVWGLDSNIPNQGKENGHPRTDSYSADIYFTFPVPRGQVVVVQLHVVDGDHCGDYENLTAAFNNIGTPGGGAAITTNAPQLVQ
ncbi:MAG: hypothetical protein JOY80_06550, partial [Candidatus Dormibacteraeota bacterium]|nr:hypothetical protein [Candidatus Dormibacteraeota bacterium]